MYMEKVNIKKINELFNGDSRKRLIIKTCAYIQQYYSNRPVMVVVDGDTIYTGRLSTLNKSSIELLSPATTELDTDGDLQVNRQPTQSVTIENPEHILNPCLKGMKSKKFFVIHNAVNSKSKYIQLDSELKSPLKNRSVTKTYPYVTEYHTVIGGDLYNEEKQCVEKYDEDTPISKTEIKNNGYLNKNKQLPLHIFNQPYNEVNEVIPYESYPVLNNMSNFLVWDSYELTKSPKTNDASKFSNYILSHEYVHFHSDENDIDSYTNSYGNFMFSAVMDSTMMHNEEAICVLNKCSFTNEAHETLQKAGINNRSEDNEQNQKPENKNDKDELPEKFTDNAENAVLIVGKKTNNDREVKNPCISIGTYSIPLSKVFPRLFLDFEFDDILKSSYGLTEDDEKIPMVTPDKRVLLQLYSNYDLNKNILYTNPIITFEPDEKMYTGNSDNVTGVHNIIMDTDFDVVNKDIATQDSPINFTEHNNNRTLAQRANIDKYNYYKSTMFTNMDGNWYASTELFESNVPSVFWIFKNGKNIGYTPIDIVDNSSNKDIRIKSSISKSTDEEDIEIISFEDKSPNNITFSNTELTQALYDGLLLPPTKSSMLSYPNPR